MTARSPEPQHVLFIDDDADHLSLVQRLVETELGVQVDLATTSAGAELRLNERCYDVVICDVNLQGELGTTICQRLLERDPQQPVLLLTNYDVAKEAARLGVPLYPKIAVAEDAFLSLLKHLLSRRPCRTATANRTASARHQNVLQRFSEPLRLTSPLVAAARASRL